MVKFSGSWIWAGADVRGYNQAAAFRKTFKVAAVPKAARLAFSADTVARIYINGEWIADGPCRGWPHAYHYDQLDVARHLRAGVNEIGAVVRYHGVGTFHQIPQHAGFLLQLDVDDGDGLRVLAQTDATWEAQPHAPWKRWTPKVCIQMGPAEWIDARVEAGAWTPATIVAPADAGPWGTLRPRDVVAAGQYDVAMPASGALHVVKPVRQLPWAVPVVHLCHPGRIATNIQTSRGLGLAVTVRAERDLNLPVRSPGWIAYLNGERCDETLALKAGANALLYFVRNFIDHKFEAVLDEPSAPGIRLESALGGDAGNTWTLVPMPQFDWLESDLCWLQPPRAGPRAERGALSPLLRASRSGRFDHTRGARAVAAQAGSARRDLERDRLGGSASGV
jgi:hypothetical protein